jgi:hypothetical protein
VTAKPCAAQHGHMTTSHHTQGSVGVSDRKLKAWERLEGVVVLAVSIAIVLGLTLAASTLLPLEFVVPRPR